MSDAATTPRAETAAEARGGNVAETTTTTPPPPASRARAVIALLLLLVGVQLWLVAGRGMLGSGLQLKVAVAALALAVIPPVHRWFDRLLERARSASPRATVYTATAVAVLSCAYLLLTAWGQGRVLVPRLHDEFSYLLQARMLAAGRLWMPAHPLAPFFESFHMFAEPVYASVYFPGTALLFVPAAWIGLPHWVMPLLASGATVGLTYYLVARLTDGATALLAPPMLLSLEWFRAMSLLAMSHAVLPLAALLMLAGWLRWRRGPGGMGWALLTGACAGWAAVTRPIDAAAYAIPLALATLVALRQTSRRTRAISVSLMVAGAVPFLALQVVANRGITGAFFETPYRRYIDVNHPNTALGSDDFTADARPGTRLPQKQKYFDDFIAPQAAGHRPGRWLAETLGNRLPLVVQFDLPHPWLVALWPVGVLALADTRRWALWASAPLLLALYALNPFFLTHYPVVVAPSIVFGVLLGKHVLEGTLPRLRPFIATVVTLSAVGWSVAILPEFDRTVADDVGVHDYMVRAANLEREVRTPAIVLFAYTPGDPVDEEPVYNVATAWPDDAPIVRAHDLGAERNGALFDYYSDRQPGRHVYRLDRRTSELEYLGVVSDLAATQATPPTRPATRPAE